MRRLITLLAAAAIVAAPLATAGEAMAKDHRDGGGRPEQRGDQRGRGPGDGQGWRGGGGGDYRHGAPGGYRGDDRGGARYEQPAPRYEPRADPRYEQRYDPRNGGDPRYGGRAYAPPPAAYESAPRRGGYLGRGGGEVIQDPGRFRLRAPPRGYTWVRTPGGMALVSQATGQVFDVVPN